MFNFSGTSEVLYRTVTNYGDGWSAYTVISWIKSDLTNSDQGWFGLGAPNGSDRFCGPRYDANGTGGGTNLLKFALYIDTGGPSADAVVESANNTQTTNVQFVVGRWQSGSAPQLWLDGVQSTPTYEVSQTGTVNLM